MAKREDPAGSQRQQRREFRFVPRIINPFKIKDVIIFSTDETVRNAWRVLQSEMPWLQVHVLTNPAATASHRSAGEAVFIVDDVTINLADLERIRATNEDAVIVLLSFVRFVQFSPPGAARREYPYTARADLIFAVNRDEFKPDRIITAVVRAAEDHLNIRKRAEVRRFIVLIVDDEPSWPSHFLPILYGIIGQRAVVKITRTYEETLKFLFGTDREAEIPEDCSESGQGERVVCLITDIFFPRGEEITADAGKQLIRLVNRHYPRIPIVIASKAKEAAELADKGLILPKGDPGSLETLRGYLQDRTGIGDLVIFDRGNKELYRLKDVFQILTLLTRAEGNDPDSKDLRNLLEVYGEKDKFSTWCYMHSYQALGDRLRPQHAKGQRMIRILKRLFLREILRMRCTPLVVDGTKINSLKDLLNALRQLPSEKFQKLSDDDIISSWLDHKGYSELAEALRPIHGTGEDLSRTLGAAVEKWANIYRDRPNADPDAK
jgi:hypothetical protein